MSLKYAYNPEPRKPRNCPTTFSCKQTHHIPVTKIQTENKNGDFNFKWTFKMREDIGEGFTLTISKGSPPNSIQPIPMVKKSYNTMIPQKFNNSNKRDFVQGVTLRLTCNSLKRNKLISSILICNSLKRNKV